MDIFLTIKKIKHIWKIKHKMSIIFSLLQLKRLTMTINVNQGLSMLFHADEVVNITFVRIFLECSE